MTLHPWWWTKISLFNAFPILWQGSNSAALKISLRQQSMHLRVTHGRHNAKTNNEQKQTMQPLLEIYKGISASWQCYNVPRAKMKGKTVTKVLVCWASNISEKDSFAVWWLSKMFAEAAVMLVQLFSSKFNPCWDPRHHCFQLRRCLGESRWERSVSSFIHGGKYLKVVKLLELLFKGDRTLRENFFSIFVAEFHHLGCWQAEIVRKKGKNLLNDPLFNKVSLLSPEEIN